MNSISSKGGYASLLTVLVILLLPLSAQAAENDAKGTDSYTPTVLITGANRGLGLEFTRQYAALGWTVIATTRKPDAAEDLQALAAEHSNITIEQLDVNDFDQIDALAERYKEQPVDVLLNNAGISGSPSPKQLFQRLDYELFDAYMHTNARGPLKISEAFLPQVRASQKKRMVTISSLGGSFAAREGMPPGTMFYRASKSALNMLMVNVAQSVAKYDITVVLLNPGLVDTQGVLTKMNEKMNMGLDLTPIEDSIAGMIDVIETATPVNSGTIYQWTGKILEY
jgi:NAD(P)-dependent dehydrogenase (short-subunit alcohol dehydrogenase family)